MRGLRITLDKSAVYGLNSEEVDSLDRYFFQIVPAILTNEILVDLAKEADPKIPNRIAAYTYRVSGNHGLTLNYRTRLFNSLLGSEVPMDERFLPPRETIIRTASGSLASLVETPLEDEVLARWERRDFSDNERNWAPRFRRQMQRPLNTQLYLDNIAAAGLAFTKPDSDEELFSCVNKLLADRKLLPRLFSILVRDFDVSPANLREITARWYKEGRRPFDEFAPYAFFCLKASFLWHLSLTNPRLFKPDKKQNDRKDLEYCYYLPNTQVFATNDEKQLRLMTGIIRPYQSLVDADELKRDLRKISEDWNKLTREEKIALNAQRADAPPENVGSLVYQLWKTHDGQINPSKHHKIVERKIIDPSLPQDQQVPFTFSQFAKKKYDEIRAGRQLTEKEIEALNRTYKGSDPTTMRLFNSKIARERIGKWYPDLTEADMNEWDSDIQNQLWLDLSEYGHFVFVD